MFRRRRRTTTLCEGLKTGNFQSSEDFYLTRFGGSFFMLVLVVEDFGQAALASIKARRSDSRTPTRRGLSLTILSSWRLCKRRRVSWLTPAMWAASGRLTTLSV